MALGRIWDEVALVGTSITIYKQICVCVSGLRNWLRADRSFSKWPLEPASELQGRLSSLRLEFELAQSKSEPFGAMVVRPRWGA